MLAVRQGFATNSSLVPLEIPSQFSRRNFALRLHQCASGGVRLGDYLFLPWNGQTRRDFLDGRYVRSTCQRSVRPAIHVPSRGSPRSSSTSEPSDPPFRAIYGVTQLLSRFRFILATTAGSEGLRPGLHGPLSSVLRRYHLFSTSPTELSSEPI